MQEAVVVASSRTPLAKSFRGPLNVVTEVVLNKLTGVKE